MVFSTFFNLGLNLAIRSSLSELQIMSQLPVLFLLTVGSFSVFGCKEDNQSDFSIDHLVMSMCRVVDIVDRVPDELWTEVLGRSGRHSV